MAACQSVADALCMGLLAIAAAEWDGSTEADYVDKTVVVIELACLGGEQPTNARPRPTGRSFVLQDTPRYSPRFCIERAFGVERQDGGPFLHRALSVGGYSSRVGFVEDFRPVCSHSLLGIGSNIESGTCVRNTHAIARHNVPCMP